MRGPPATESLDFLLVQVCRLHHSRAHALLESVGLHRGQPRLLWALWETDGLTHTGLASRLQVQPATITRMVQRMEKAGFVARKPDQHDQRVSRVYLTETGNAVREQVHQIWQQLEEEALAGLSPEEREALRGLYMQIRDNLMRVTGFVPAPSQPEERGEEPEQPREAVKS